MVVMDWKSAQRSVNKPQQTYLLVSRVTSRNALVALTPFTQELAAWSKPPASALTEEERLNHLSDVTLAMFQSSTAVNAAASPRKLTLISLRRLATRRHAVVNTEVSVVHANT
jgi:hypothetical protein